MSLRYLQNCRRISTQLYRGIYSSMHACLILMCTLHRYKTLEFGAHLWTMRFHYNPSGKLFILRVSLYVTVQLYEMRVTVHVQFMRQSMHTSMYTPLVLVCTVSLINQLMAELSTSCWSYGGC